MLKLLSLGVLPIKCTVDQHIWMQCPRLQRDAEQSAGWESRRHTGFGGVAGAMPKASAGRYVVSPTGYQLGGLQLVEPQVRISVRHGDTLVIWRNAHAAAIVLELQLEVFVVGIAFPESQGTAATAPGQADPESGRVMRHTPHGALDLVLGLQHAIEGSLGDIHQGDDRFTDACEGIGDFRDAAQGQLSTVAAHGNIACSPNVGAESGVIAM